MPNPGNPLKLVDLGVGMAAALAAQMFAHLDAAVVRLEPPAGDPFYAVYPAYAQWRQTARRLAADALDAELADADLCIVGGESWPGLDWRFDADDLARRFPRLVVLDITSYASADAAGRPAVDLLVQARTGLAREEYSQRPMAYAVPMPSYGAALLGVIGAQAALVERSRSGKGQVVRSSMQQGAAAWVPGIWSGAERPDHAFKVGTPKDVKQPVFRCADGSYLILMFGTPGSLATIYRTLDIDIAVDPTDRNLPDIRRGLANYFCDRSILEPAFAQRDRQAVLEGLWQGGVAADAVLPAGGAWDDPQVVHNGIIRTDADGVRSVGSPIALRLVEAGNDAAPEATPAPAATRNGPLAGIRIVDLGNWVAGPYASKLLGDLGAEVIKVEAPGGDPFRFMYRNFASVTRGKRSIVLDLKTPEGREVLQRLCATADIVSHNMRVGVAERNGFDPKTLRQSNPKLVTIHSSAYGSSGPKAMNSGWDPVLQPYCGHAIRAGGEGNDPLVYQIPVLDYGTGVLGAIGLLQGLLRRDATGAAVEVEANLLDSGIYMLSELIQQADGGFAGAPVLDAEQTGFHPAERFYQAEDGWIAVAARDAPMAERLAAVLGLDLGPRADWDGATATRIAAAMARRGTDELVAAFAAADVWAERAVDDAWTAMTSNPAAIEAGLVAARDDDSYGRLTGVGQLLGFGRSPLEHDLGALPAAGQDTRAILAELGYADAEIERLAAVRVVG